jgi:hypothetical protein
LTIARVGCTTVGHGTAPYHLTSRGHDRKAIFKDDSDRELFLNTLARVTARFHWICHGYCLMNNPKLAGTDKITKQT